MKNKLDPYRLEDIRPYIKSQVVWWLNYKTNMPLAECEYAYCKVDGNVNRALELLLKMKSNFDMKPLSSLEKYAKNIFKKKNTYY